MCKIGPKAFILKNGGKGVIRIAEAADAEKMLVFLDQMMRDDQFFLLTGDDIKKQNLDAEKEKEWIRKHQQEGCIAVIAEVDENIAGLVEVLSSPLQRARHIGVLSISLLEQYRGQGLGSLLMETILTWAQENPIIEKVTLSVFDNNPRAMNLYRKFGFVEEGRKIKEIKFGPDNYADSIIMSIFVK